MRRDNLAVGSYYHVVIRGAGGLPFFHDEDDWWLGLKLLYYLNDESLVGSTWRRDLVINKCALFERPAHWPPRQPRIKILAFCLHDNHIHLLVKEIKGGGLTAFMRRFPNSLSNCHRMKYRRSGSIFQAAYKLRRIADDGDLQNVALYIMVKNGLERYPNGGLKGAMSDLESAWIWAKQDPFSSLPDYAGRRNSPVIERDLLRTILPEPKKFLLEAREYLKWRDEQKGLINDFLWE